MCTHTVTSQHPAPRIQRCFILAPREAYELTRKPSCPRASNPEAVHARATHGKMADGVVLRVWHQARRRHLNIRGKSANLPAITDKDWLDLKFGIDVGVDYYALSFVRSADVIYELKDYLAKQGAPAGGTVHRERSHCEADGWCDYCYGTCWPLTSYVQLMSEHRPCHR